MIVVLASRLDDAAPLLVNQLRKTCAAALVVPRDLSIAGWRLHVPGGPQALVVNNTITAVTDLRGIVVRLTHVAEEDLTHIVSEDRAYVAAEMSAFLHAWLSAAPVPVLNRPGPNSLCGPGWVPDQWRFVAAASGIPIHRAPQLPSAHDFSSAGGESVIGVGDLTIGSANETLRHWTGTLSRAANVPMLVAHFHKQRLVSAGTFVDVSREDVAEAITTYFADGTP